MRNIDSQIIAACLSPARKVQARAVFQDNRIVFAAQAQADTNDTHLAKDPANGNPNGWEWCEAEYFNGYLIRLAGKYNASNLRLSVQAVSNPAQTWPAWQATTLTIPANSKAGLKSGRIWCCATDYRLYVADYNPANGAYSGSFVTGWSFPAGARVILAPVSPSECYALVVQEAAQTAIACIHYIKLDAFSVAQHSEWKGVVHCTPGKAIAFDAERLDGMDYCYFTVDDGQRTAVIPAVAGEGFGSPQDIFPLDYADDTARFILGSVAVVGSHILACGTLTRAAGSPMQVYTFGPEHHTAGRELFIGRYGAADFQKGGRDYRAGQGGLIAAGSDLWFLFPSENLKANRPAWLSGSSPSWIYSANNVQMSYDQSGSASLSLEVPSNLNAAIRAGFSLFLEILVESPGANTPWFRMGEYEVDAISTRRMAEGLVKSVVARPKGIKRLAQWKADASYDYWSQAARRSPLGDQRYNVRLGHLKTVGDNAVLPDGEGQIGSLYSSERASTSYAVRVKAAVSGDKMVFVGPLASTHTETRLEAAARLGLPVESVNASSVLTSGILFLYQNDLAPGFSLRWYASDQAWSGGIPNCPYAGLSGPYETNFSGEVELLLVYNDGRLDAYFRSPVVPEWSQAYAGVRFEQQQNGEYILPYSRSDGRGRVGYFGRYASYGASKIAYHAHDAISPVGDGRAPGTPTGITLEPPVSYGGQTYRQLMYRNGTLAASMNSRSYQPNLMFLRPWATTYASVPSQPWDNPRKNELAAVPPYNWIWLDQPIPANAGSIDYFQGCILELSWVPSGTRFYEIDKLDDNPPYFWNMLVEQQAQQVGDNPPFLQHVGDPAYGFWDKLTQTVRDPVTAAWTYYTRGVSPMRVTVKSLENGLLPPSIPYKSASVAEVSTKILPAVRMASYPILSNYSALPANTVTAVQITQDSPVGEEITVASGDLDMSFAWMAKEICRKAGVLDVTIPSEVSSYSHTANQWTLDADSATQRRRYRTGIVRFQVKEQEIGVMAAESGGALLGGAWNGTIVTASSQVVRQYKVTNGVVALKEEFSFVYGDKRAPLGSWVTVSFADDKASVWINGAILAAFTVDTQVNSLMLVSPAYVSTSVDWPTLDMRVDNFVLDIGQSGIDLLRRLIKRKRIRFCDDGQGGVKIYRDGEAVNTSNTPYTMSTIASATDSDTSRITRLRMEGVEVYEVVHDEGLSEYGNVFALENFDELEYPEQFSAEGALYLDDFRRSSKPNAYQGAADPRVEPWDKLWVQETKGGTVRQVVVKSVTFHLSTSEDGAVFDMEVEGEEA